MNKKEIFGVCLIVAAVVSLIPFISVAQPRQLPNGIIEGDQEEVITHKEKAIADCGFNRAMRVASFVSNPPFGWVEAHDGVAGKEYVGHGFALDFFDKIAKKLNIRYIPTGFTSYQKAITALKRGELDLLIGVYTPGNVGRGSRPVYPSFFKNMFTVYYPNNRAFPAYSFASLEGKRGIIRREENIYPLFSRYIQEGMSLTLVNTAKKAFQMLMDGEADYLIGSPYSIEAELRRYKLYNDIVPADWVALDANMFFVLTTNTDCFKLKEVLSREISASLADEKQIRSDLINVINEWGERFRENEPLMADTWGEKGEDSEESHLSQEGD